MDVEKYQRLSGIFETAWELDAADLDAFLERECSGLEERRAVEELLAEARDTSGAKVATSEFRGYQIHAVVGHGNLGTVYRATSAATGAAVALKVLHPVVAQHPAIRDRFRREAELLERLRHPGIASLWEAQLENSPPYLVFDFVEGDALSTISGRYGANTTQALRGALGLAEALARILQSAHEAGIIHRDLKPSNIVVRPDGSPVIVDFGSGRRIHGEDLTLTITGQLVGSPAYSSPEHFAGDPADARSDVWSLGIILFELLTGSVPFLGETAEAIQSAVSHDPIPAMSGTPGSLSTVLCRALEKDPEFRYSSAEEFADDLARVQRGEAAIARPSRRFMRAKKWVTRNPTRSVVIFSLSLAAVVSLCSFAWAVKAKQQTTSAFLLADLPVSEGLIRRERLLWPSRKIHVPRMDSWLERSTTVLSRRADHEQMIRRLRNDVSGPAQRRALQAHEEILRSLQKLKRLRGRVEARRALATRFQHESIQAEAATWTRCASHIEADPRYGDLNLSPQVGLVPLGRDQRSGLWEFWCLDSGSRPAWRGDFESGEIDLDHAPDSAGLVLVLVPSGEFWMGAQCASPDEPNFDRFASTQLPPPEYMNVEAFFLAKYEVTQAQFELIMGRNPSTALAGRELLGEKITSQNPVDNVSWFDATEFAWRSGLRLPNEIEWEYACRAGTSTPWFSGTDVVGLAEYANLEDRSLLEHSERPGQTMPLFRDGFAVTAPIGSLRPNAFGFFDLLGNVAEWQEGSRTRVLWPDAPYYMRRRVRGGAWDYQPRAATVYETATRSPFSMDNSLGIRVARSIDPDWSWRPRFLEER